MRPSACSSAIFISCSRHPHVVGLDEPHLAEVVLAMRVEAGGDEDHLRPERRAAPAATSTRRCWRTTAAVGVRGHRHVDHVRRRMVGAAVRIERVLEEADHQHALVVGEDVLGAVAVMDVEVDDRDALEAVHVERAARRDGDVVDEAEAHRARARRVMAGRTGRCRTRCARRRGSPRRSRRRRRRPRARRRRRSADTSSCRRRTRRSRRRARGRGSRRRGPACGRAGCPRRRPAARPCGATRSTTPLAIMRSSIAARRAGDSGCHGPISCAAQSGCENHAVALGAPASCGDVDASPVVRRCAAFAAMRTDSSMVRSAGVMRRRARAGRARARGRLWGRRLCPSGGPRDAARPSATSASRRSARTGRRPACENPACQNRCRAPEPQQSCGRRRVPPPWPDRSTR